MLSRHAVRSLFFVPLICLQLCLSGVGVARADTRAKTLAVTRVRVSGFKAGWISHGWYPSVASDRSPLRGVDRAIRGAFMAYRKWADHRSGKAGGRRIRPKGFFVFDNRWQSLVATSRVVSFITPTTVCRLPSVFCAKWFALTAAVPTGARVRMRALFRPRLLRRALESIRRTLRREIPRRNSCVRATADYSGLRAVAANYERFGLTRSGIRIGLGQGQIAGSVCGTPSGTVGYSVLAAYLSRFGRRLASAAEAP